MDQTVYLQAPNYHTLSVDLQNISLHSTTTGYLHKKSIIDLNNEIERLWVLALDKIPAKSRFLLKIGPEAISQSHTKMQAYWVKAVTAARRAKARERAKISTARRNHGRSNMKLAS